MAITMNLYYTGTDGSARRFAQEMEESGTADLIRAEQGNLRYEYFLPMNNPETVLLIDSWENQEAIDAHHESPMMQTIAQLREKYDLHMKVERYLSDEVPETDAGYCRIEEDVEEKQPEEKQPEKKLPEKEPPKEGQPEEELSEEERPKEELLEKEPPVEDGIDVKAVAYTDGGYNINNAMWGYGACLLVGDKEYEVSGCGEDLYNGRQIQGETTAALEVCEKALSMGIRELEIRYDYEGVRHWAMGTWKTNKPYTKEYARKMHGYRQQMAITFTHVKAHTGIEGNEKVDKLAKAACGL